MKTVARLSPNERWELFRNTAARMGLPDAIVEKDFWVCYTLDWLFHRSPWREHITFKGGTSLSKGRLTLPACPFKISMVCCPISCQFGDRYELQDVHYRKMILLHLQTSRESHPYSRFRHSTAYKQKEKALKPYDFRAFCIVS